MLALTVDHRLHPDSARWTAEAGAKAKALGANWRALIWEGAKPATGLPAAARNARHALLADAARGAGARVVLMGHTASDIAEGEIMRASDSPGLGRLREWGPSPVWPDGRGVFLLRPLLDATREDLRDFLREQDESWLDDPANEDLRHPRIRARRGLEATDAKPETVQRTPSGCPAELARELSVRPDGGIVGSRAAFVHTAPGEAASVLAAALLCVAGRGRPPRGEPLRRVLAQIVAGVSGTATLGGCRIDIERERIVITRAPPRRGQPAIPFEPSNWIAARFAAACGLVTSEAEASAPFTATL